MRDHNIGRSGAAISAVMALLFLSCLFPARGQLAITEVMSSATNGLATNTLPALSDFWELTNFGTNSINLNGYRWNDNQGGLGGDSKPLDGLVIGPGESIVFVQSLPVTNAQQFFEWWGPGLPSKLQVVFYSGNGFAGQGDSVRLWGPDAVSDADVIDSVDFGDARTGQTFTYDPATGLFGQFSSEGVDGAFKALSRDDVGSPGITAGPVPLRILAQPTSATVCAGIDVTFAVEAGGLPRPRYQWFHDGEPIPDATSARLTIFNPQAANAGQYRVRLDNAASVIWSEIATLSVSSDPTPPTIFTPFADVEVLAGETARFFAPVCAFPPPRFQWSTNGVPVAGATNRTLVLANCDLSLSNSLICVAVENALGSTNFCARLIVSEKPRLFVTEVMGYASTNCPDVEQEDWFEVTNFDSRPVNLKGYRFASGNGFPPTLDGARTVGMPVILQPDESVVFVRNLSADEFRHWWGADGLPPGLKIIPYSGLGIRSLGDELYLWSPGAEDPDDYVAAVSFAGFDPGVSKRFDCRTDPNAVVCFAGEDSVAGAFGAFRAELCDDVGSPGFVTNPPPRMVRLTRDAGGVTVRWRGIVGRGYQLKYKDWLEDPSWNFLSEHVATNFVMNAVDSAAGDAPQRFYRIEEIP